MPIIGKKLGQGNAELYKKIVQDVKQGNMISFGARGSSIVGARHNQTSITFHILSIDFRANLAYLYSIQLYWSMIVLQPCSPLGISTPASGGKSRTERWHLLHQVISCCTPRLRRSPSHLLGCASPFPGYAVNSSQLLTFHPFLPFFLSI